MKGPFIFLSLAFTAFCISSAVVGFPLYSISHSTRALLLTCGVGCGLVTIATGRRRGEKNGNSDIGLKKIRGCDNANRTADVVFIHGLNGHRDLTWGLFPQWLAEAIPEVGVWTLGYHASPSRWWGQSMPITDRAKNALQYFRTDNLGNRKLILITHSLGGVLAKAITRHAADSHDPLAANVGGIAFLATPHTGSGLATIIREIGILRPTFLLGELKATSPHLRDLNEWYRSNSGPLRIDTLVFYETQRLILTRIVADDRADPGLPGVVPIPVDENHESICKPKTKDCLVFKSVTGFVKRCLAKGSAAPTPAPAPALVPTPAATPVPSAPNPVNIFFGQVTIEQNTIIAAPGAPAIRNPKPGERLQTLTGAPLDAQSLQEFSRSEAILQQQFAKQEEAADLMQQLELYIDIDFPMACSKAEDAERWLEDNAALIPRQMRGKIRNLLARVEVGKFQRKMITDLSRADAFLKEPET